MAQPFANNGDLVFNALDNLAGSADLISVRGRATFSRPFDRVESAAPDADDRVPRQGAGAREAAARDRGEAHRSCESQAQRQVLADPDARAGAGARRLPAREGAHPQGAARRQRRPGHRTSRAWAPSSRSSTSCWCRSCSPHRHALGLWRQPRAQPARRGRLQRRKPSHDSRRVSPCFRCKRRGARAGGVALLEPPRASVDRRLGKQPVLPDLKKLTQLPSLKSA